MNKFSKLKVLSILGLSLILGLGAVSCGNNDTPPTTTTNEPTTINVESVLLTATQNFVKVTQTLSLNTIISPSNATNKKVTYTASNDCVTVSEDGIVTGVKVGEVIVTVTTEDGNKTSSVNLTVIENSEYGHLGLDDFVSALSSTPYKLKGLSGQERYGLATPEEVGVDESQVKELYKVDDGQNYTHTINISDITLEQVQTYFSNATELNDYYRIQTAINLAEEYDDDNGSSNFVKISFPGGKMNVDATLFSSSQAFDLNNLNNVTLDGNGTVINLITKDMNWKGYLKVSNSSNILLHNLTFKLENPSSLTGKITTVDVEEKSITLSVDKEFGKLLKDAKRLNKAIRSWVEFDHINKAPLEGGNFIVDNFSSYEVSGDDSVGYTLKVYFKSNISRSRNNTHVAVSFSQYDAYGMTVGYSNNVYIENITMHHASGMGFTSNNTSNMYVNRFNLCLEENSNLLMTATADAMHFNHMSGNVIIQNSLIEYSHDDALNLKHGYWYKLANATGGQTKEMTVTRITSEVPLPSVGSKVAVYNEETFEGHNPTQGYYTIKTIETTASGFTFTVNERMSNVGEWGKCRVTFMSDTPDFTFTNNIIRNKRNRGVLVQVPNATISNNTFMNVGHGSIQAASAMDIYNEATIPQSPTIKNNKFINNCYIKPEPLYGDIAIFAISNNASVGPSGSINDVTIENNYVANNGNASISIRAVGDSTIESNLFYNPSRMQPSGDTFNCIVHMYNCADIDLLNNYNYYTLDRDLSGLILQGKTSPNDINLDASNKNIEFQRNEEAGPDINVAKSSNILIVDGDLSDWATAGATTIEIDGVSDAEGTARSLSEIQANFAVNSLMITHDDKGIYLGFDIYDNEINCKTVNDFWLGDCVEIFMTSVTDMPNADMQVYKEEGGVIQAAFAPAWERNGFYTYSSVRTNSKYLNSALEVKIVQGSTGYVGEVLIPFSLFPEFKTTIDEGKPIAMAIVCADAERAGGLKRVQAANVPHFVEDYKTKSARMPQYYFN